jgi:putative nucleotidyltransferase with HDIG domain
MKRRVLFVDDEPNVLDGLRRMLRPLRNEWDMRFAPGGSAALELMAAQPADVLVTDMRMPGMDGDELLAAVCQRSPLTVRIVLTGQCTREAMLRLVRVAHRVLNKPCDPDELKAAVQRACSLQDLLQSPPLVALIGRLGSLPTPPALYTRIVTELQKPDGSIAEVGELIAQDLGLAAKLMQMANSSLLGLRNRSITPTQALQALGTETTKALVLVSDVLTRYDPAAIHPFSIDDLWGHSHEVAALAGAIAQAEVGRAHGAEARLVGLLHDVGRLTLVSQRPAEYREVFRLTRDERLALTDAERHVFGATHADVGAYLLGLWGLPSSVVESVAWHHAPGASPVKGFGPLAAVHAAETIVAPDEGGPADGTYFAALGMTDRLPVWAELRHRAASAGRTE